MNTEELPDVHDGFNRLLRVDVPRQVLSIVENGAVIAEFPVSTSRFGLGTEPGSYKTPLGKFFIEEKIGDDLPLGAVLKSRVATGEVSGQGGEEDKILTRILWLTGSDLENANTRERYIYIHGTNQENLIGTPASHGCVRMRNTDIVNLYSLIPRGTPVEIVA